MPFGLCSSLGTFQRCMMSIFSNMLEDAMEIFMDDFSVSMNTFDQWHEFLSRILKRFESIDLALNWEKCHFMVREGIVLGHKVLRKGLQLDQTKVEVIEKLPPPTNLKGVRSFLCHVGFYKEFIMDFSKITKPLCNLLEKKMPLFQFWWSLSRRIGRLKEKLNSAPIIASPEWSIRWIKVWS